MSENLPAVPTQGAAPLALSREVTTTDTDSWIGVLQNIGHLAELICGTEFVPKNLRNSAPATAAAIMYGREVGLPPMTALTQTHVIEGRPSMSAEAMRALIVAGGHEIVFDEATGAICRMRGRRRDSTEWTAVSWTIDAARAAGLLGKDNWKKYPRAMLVARCTADLARMVFPDVIHGFRAVEETEDTDEDAPADAGFGEPATSTTKVTRKRSAAKKAAAALPAAPPAAGRASAPAGPPLPGEAGYDAQAGATEQASGASGDDSPDHQSEGAGKDSEDAPDAAPVTVDPPTDETAEEPVDAELVPDPDDELAAKRDKDAAPRKASRAQQRMMHASFANLGITDDEPGGRDERLHITSIIASRSVESSADLSSAEISHVIDTLARCRDRVQLNELLDGLES